MDGNSGDAFAPASGFGVGDGGIGVILSGPIMIMNSRVLNNEGTGSHLATGGLEFFDSEPAILSESKWTRNRAEAPFAIGGIELNGTIAAITDGKVQRNIASGDFAVGGIDVDGGVVTIEDTKVKNNDPIDCFGLLCERR